MGYPCIHIRLADSNATLNIRKDKIAATYVSDNSGETTIYLDSGKWFAVPTNELPEDLIWDIMKP